MECYEGYYLVDVPGMNGVGYCLNEEMSNTCLNSDRCEVCDTSILYCDECKEDYILKPLLGADFGYCVTEDELTEVCFQEHCKVCDEFDLVYCFECHEGHRLI